MDFKRILACIPIMSLISCPSFSAPPVKLMGNYDAKKNWVDDNRTSLTQEATIPPLLNQSDEILNKINQNRYRAMPYPRNAEWVQRIHWNGAVSVDVLKSGNTHSNFMGVNYQRFSFNDAYLNIGVEINSWAKAFASISDDTATIQDRTSGNVTSEYSAAYSNNTIGGHTRALQLEQAYATLSHLEEVPIFLQVGKQFQDFSRYAIHPITRTLTQSLSEILATSLKLGFIFPNGFRGSISVFNDPVPKTQLYNPIKHIALNYIIALGYDQRNETIGFDVGASLVHNLIAANDVAYHMQQILDNDSDSAYFRRVSGMAVYGDISSGPLTMSARYTQALRPFDSADLPYLILDPIYGITFGSKREQKPWAAGVQADYKFNRFGSITIPQNIYVGYQVSRETPSLGLPKSRWVLGYIVTPLKNTAFTLEWDHDRDFDIAEGAGTGMTYNLVTLRATFKFA